MPALGLFVLLAAFWILLSGQLDSAHAFLIGAGVVCCAFTTWIARRMGSFDRESNPWRYALPMLGYLPWLMWEVVKANVDVAVRIWHPRMPIAPRMVRVPVDLDGGFTIAVYANSITLTPGTATVEAGEREFLVHALTASAAADLEGGEMHRRVRRLEGRR